MFASSNFQRLLKSAKLDPTNPRPPKRQKRTIVPAPADLSNQPISPPKPEITPAVALDCEMVGIGEDGLTDCLARCSVVNSKGEVLYDEYVKTNDKVVDYRTAITGLTRTILAERGISFKECQKQVQDIIKNRILVGHSINHDLQVLEIAHPKHLVRDTAFYKPLCPDRPKQLKKLVLEHMHIDIQTGAHDSIEDARAVMKLYDMFRKDWEKIMRKKTIRSMKTGVVTMTKTVGTTLSEAEKAAGLKAIGAPKPQRKRKRND